MYRCTHCGRRFTGNNGIINGVSQKKTSAKLSLSIGTVFSMRHRFLCSLEKHADNVKVRGNVQLDETFVSEAFFLATIIFARGSSQLRLNYVRT